MPTAAPTSTTAAAVSAAAPTTPATLSFGGNPSAGIAPSTYNTTTGQQVVTSPTAIASPTQTQGSTPSGSSANPASSTTLSSQNKANSASAIQNTTNNVSNTGISTNPNGTTTYANGTIYNPQQPASATNLPPGEQMVNGQLTYTGQNGPTNYVDASTGVTPTGGYDASGVYYAPGQAMTPDANGNYPQLTSQSPQDAQIMSGLTTLKTQADSLTTSLVDNITASYQALITQQQQVNAGELASVQGTLDKGGVTGQGSQAQFNPISSAQILQGQMSYGINQISTLQSQMNSDIIKANQAGMDEDIQLQDQINQQITATQKTMQDAAGKIQDLVNAAAQKLNDAKLQQTKDSFVASELQAGITDPNQILKDAQAQGLDTLTASDIGTSMAALSPDKSQIQSLAAQAAAAGADPATVAKIASSANFNDALTLATPALGEKVAADKAQQAFQDKIAQENVNIAQENADTNRDKLTQDNSAAGLAANNALVTTPIIGANGKPLTYVNGTGLSDAAKAAALSAGQVVLDGDSATAMTQITNTLGQVNNLLATFKSNGVDLSTGAGQTRNGFFSSNWTNAAGTATPAVQAFATALQGTTKTDGIISDLQKLPGTGNLVSVLENNIPSTSDSASIMNGKIIAITGALNSAANSFLSSGSTPQNGQTGTIQVDGKSVTATYNNGTWNY
jgi:hypothetical protein